MNSSEHEPSTELLEDATHSIELRVDRKSGDVYLAATSRLALRELALTLLNQAEAGLDWSEYYPLGVDGSWLVVNGARFTEESSRLFVSIGRRHAS
ncbi:MAG: hypothetical protein E6Q78_07675 [Rhodoferax sp.]|nr:MAG: hypothetical protein E6Q78_07675 [Rhodoferax sp.]